MPSERDLTTLPYFAILSLGARAARIAEPLLKDWKQVSTDQLQILDNALRSIEELSRIGSGGARAAHWVTASDNALKAADVASQADDLGAPLHALLAADSVAELADAIDPERMRSRAAKAVKRSLEASTQALMESGGSAADFRQRLDAEFERLGSQAADDGWTDDSPVPIEAMKV